MKKCKVKSVKLKVPIFLVFLFIFFVFSKEVLASDVVINEFSSATSDDDWVELYNTSSQSVDLSNYTLIDGSTSGNKVSFSCILAPLGFTIASWSNRLNNGGDIIKLKNVDTVSDCVAYGDGADKLCDGKSSVEISSISSGEFGARSTDGGSWVKVTSATKDGPNDGSAKSSGAICSTPTPTPTAAPTASPAPSPTPSPTKTSTPNPTPKPSATPTRSPSPVRTKSSQIDSNEIVLGVQSSPTPLASPTEEPSALTQGWFVPSKILPFIFIGSGVLLLGGVIFSFVRQRKFGYNVPDEGRNQEQSGNPEFGN